MRLSRQGRSALWIILGLAAMTVWVYARVATFQFTNYDDTLYVTRNPYVLGGLGWKGIGWALTATWAANWHPVTWLSHMSDVSLFGPDPGMHHLVNLAFHVLNASLLFLLLRRLTGALWASAFVAALFAVHPLHVESVAWIAERKDVLSMFLALLTLLAYERYARGSRRMLGLAGLAFVLGLMAKPMLVSLPILMLLLDRWPLGRTATLPGLIREKWVFFALAAGSCLVTVVAQQRGMALVPIEHEGIAHRVVNAVAAYGGYLLHMVWPARLAILYTLHPIGRTLPMAGLSALALTGITVAAVRERGRRPYLLMGWLWFLVSLLPVIGLVQVGRQAMADRYTYLPLVGPFIALTWMGADLAGRWRIPLPARGAAMGAVLAVLMVVARVQAGYWKDSITLFRHCEAATGGDSPVPFANEGSALLDADRPAEALAAVDRAIAASGAEYLPFELRGEACRKLGRTGEALDAYGEALRRNPLAYVSAFGAAEVLHGLGRDAEALTCFHYYLFLEPTRLATKLDREQQLRSSQEIRIAIGLTLKELGRPGEAVAAFREALAHAPRDPQILMNLGLALGASGDHAGALQMLAQVVAVAPGQAPALCAYGEELARAGRKREAGEVFTRALALDPEAPGAAAGLRTLGVR